MWQKNVSLAFLLSFVLVSLVGAQAHASAETPDASALSGPCQPAKEMEGKKCNKTSNGAIIEGICNSGLCNAKSAPDESGKKQEITTTGASDSKAAAQKSAAEVNGTGESGAGNTSGKFQGRLSDNPTAGMENASQANNPAADAKAPVGQGTNARGEAFQSTGQSTGSSQPTRMDYGQSKTPEQTAAARLEGLIQDNQGAGRPAPGSGYTVLEKAQTGSYSKGYNVFTDAANQTFIQRASEIPRLINAFSDFSGIGSMGWEPTYDQSSQVTGFSQSGFTSSGGASPYLPGGAYTGSQSGLQTSLNGSGLRQVMGQPGTSVVFGGTGQNAGFGQPLSNTSGTQSLLEQAKIQNAAFNQQIAAGYLTNPACTGGTFCGMAAQQLGGQQLASLQPLDQNGNPILTDVQSGTQGPTPVGDVVQGKASCYGTAACGDNPNNSSSYTESVGGRKFDPSTDLTGAVPPNSPFKYGDIVQVKRADGEGEVTVRINDTCPSSSCNSSSGRVIDLSGAAAEKIGFDASGKGTVGVTLQKLDASGVGVDTKVASTDSYAGNSLTGSSGVTQPSSLSASLISQAQVDQQSFNDNLRAQAEKAQTDLYWAQAQPAIVRQWNENDFVPSSGNLTPSNVTSVSGVSPSLSPVNVTLDSIVPSNTAGQFLPQIAVSHEGALTDAGGSVLHPVSDAVPIVTASPDLPNPIAASPFGLNSVQVREGSMYDFSSIADRLPLGRLNPALGSSENVIFSAGGGFTGPEMTTNDVMSGDLNNVDAAGGAGPGTTLGGVSTSEMYSDEGSITTNHPVSVLNTAENTGSNAVPRLGGFERDQILYPDTDGEYGALDPKVIDPNGLIKVTDASPYDALPQYSSYGAQLDVRNQELADKADRAEARASEVRAAEARPVASNARSERSNGPLEGQGEVAPRWVFFNYSPLGNSEYLYPNPSPSPLGGQMSQAGSWTQIPSNTPSPFISQSEGDAFPVTPGSQTLGASYEQAVRSAEVPLSGTLDPQKSIPETVLGTDNSTGYTSTGPIDAKTIPTVDQAKAAEELAKPQVVGDTKAIGDTAKEALSPTEETKNPSAGRTERTEQLIGSGPGQLGQFGPGVTSLWGDNADFGTAPEREPVSPFIRVIPGEDQGVLSFGPSNDGAPAIAGVDANSADISLPKGLNDEVVLGPKAYYPTIQESEGVGEGEASRAPDAVSAPPAGTSEASKQGIVNQPTPGQTAGIRGDKGTQSGESGKAAVTGLGATPPAGAGPTAAPVVPPAGASPGARTGSGDPSGGKDTQGDKGGAGDIAGMLKSVMDMAKGLMGGGGGKGSGGGAPAPTTPVTANPATVLATPIPSTQFAAAVALTAAPKILVVANPNPVVSGTASTISWQAQWDDVQASSTTRECAVADVRGKTLADHVGVSDSIATPALTRAAYFVIGCKQSGGKLGSTMILIKVAGDSVAAEAPPKSLPRYETTSGLSTAGADLAAALYGSTASTGSVPASNTAEPQQQAKNMACDPNSQQYFECLTTKMQYVDKLY